MAVTLLLLVLGVVVPQQLRFRAELVDSRVEDRFSGQLRIIASGSSAKPFAAAAHRRQLFAGTPAITSGHHHRREIGMVANGGGTNLQAVTARQAVVKERAARARRRLILTCALVVANAAVWTCAGLRYLVWYFGLIPSVLLVFVLVTGTLAARKARQADAALRRRAAEAEVLSGRAAQEGAGGAAEGVGVPAELVPCVPGPAVAAAPSAVPAAYVDNVTALKPRLAVQPRDLVAVVDAPEKPETAWHLGAEYASDAADSVASDVSTDSLGLPLNEILARRRAS